MRPLNAIKRSTDRETFPCEHLYISYKRYYWLLRYKRRDYLKNTALNQVYQTGKGERT